MCVTDLNRYLKPESSADAFHPICKCILVVWFLYKWNIGQKWAKETNSTNIGH